MADENKRPETGSTDPNAKARPIPNVPVGKTTTKKESGAEYKVTPLANDVKKKTRVDVDPRFQVGRRRRR